jgi:hypothetical protein
MTIKNRILDALKFLADNQGFKVGALYLAMRDNELWIVGQTNYNDLDNLTKKIALKELDEVKQQFCDYLDLSPELASFIKDKGIRYCLGYDYGMGGIEICHYKNNEVTWSYELD